MTNNTVGVIDFDRPEPDKTEPNPSGYQIELLDLPQPIAELLKSMISSIYKHMRPSAGIENKSEIKNLKRAFGKMLPENIKPKHVYAYMDARGVASKTRANREKLLLSSIFSHMIRWGVVESNPCKVFKNFREKPRDRYVEDWEYHAVLALASPILRAAMEIAAITGTRQGGSVGSGLYPLHLP